jgi:hypothetical protein
MFTNLFLYGNNNSYLTGVAKILNNKIRYASTDDPSIFPIETCKLSEFIPVPVLKITSPINGTFNDGITDAINFLEEKHSDNIVMESNWKYELLKIINKNKLLIKILITSTIVTVIMNFISPSLIENIVGFILNDLFVLLMPLSSVSLGYCIKSVIETKFNIYIKGILLCILIRIFYVCPDWLSKYLKSKYEKHMIKNTIFNTEKLKMPLSEYDKTVFAIVPHGCSINPAVRLSTLLNYDAYIISAVPNYIFPFYHFAKSAFNEFISPDIDSVTKCMNNIGTNGGRCVVYPGGINEIFDNSCYNQPVTPYPISARSRLFRLIADNGLTLIPIVTNESKVYWQPKILVEIFRYISKFVKVALPLMPLSTFYFWKKKETMTITFGEPIIESDPIVMLEKFREFCKNV